MKLTEKNAWIAGAVISTVVLAAIRKKEEEKLRKEEEELLKKTAAITQSWIDDIKKLPEYDSVSGKFLYFKDGKGYLDKECKHQWLRTMEEGEEYFTT